MAPNCTQFSFSCKYGQACIKEIASQRKQVKCRQNKSSCKASNQPVLLPKSHTKSAQQAVEFFEQNLNQNRYLTEKKKSLISVGLTVHQAPVEIREKLSVPESEWNRAIEELTSFPHIEEAAILSTCNRMEIYVVALSYHRGVREIEEWLGHTSHEQVSELRPYLFLLRDSDAVGHLFNVSAGLDSLVMGEGQILSQIKNVYRLGQSCQSFGRHLNGLFKQAIEAGKRVRTETSISSGSVSVSSAAVELAKMKLPQNTFDNRTVCIIGAGKMSTLLVKHLISKGCKKAVVLNRTAARAQQLQEDFPDIELEIHTMEDLHDCVARSNLIFAASGAEQILLSIEDIEGMSSPPADIPRRFIDIAVPRNISSNINQLDNNIVHNVDDLVEVVNMNQEDRRQAALEAEGILVDEQATFNTWRDSLETVPTIKALRGKAEDIRSAELNKCMGKLGPDLSKKQIKAVEELSRGIINKMLHGPLTSLRCDGNDKDAVGEILTNMKALEKMYQLDQAKEMLSNV